MPQKTDLFFLLALTLFFSPHAEAQERSNPLKDKRWLTIGAGLTNADYLSVTGLISYSVRSDYIITTQRLAFSNEVESGPDDSCTVSKSNTLEYGLLWGDGWAGKTGFITFSGGFGINLRTYCDDTPLDTVFAKVTRLTAGVPAQIEAGLFINPKWSVGTAISANWNFLQPYVGGLITVTYWPGKRKST